MKQHTGAVAVAAMGIDVGDRKSEICTIDEEGSVVERATIPTTETAFRRRFSGVERIRIAIEAGTHSPWISRLLGGELGHEVIVANARKLRLIYENDNKCDRVDAEYLARLARADPKLLSPIEHRSKEALADRALLKARDALVRARTGLVNQVRGLVKSFGGRIPRCSVESFPAKAGPHVPREIESAVAPLLTTMAKLTKDIGLFEKKIAAVAKARYPVAEHLAEQIAGVGILTGLAFVLAIGDPRRFKRSRSVGSYLGLRPRRKESGNSDPQLRITKAGDSFTRKLLVQAAHYTLGPFGSDSDIRRWGLRLAERGGKNGKKRAVTAVARKLAVVLHRLWVTGEEYKPIRDVK